MNRIPISSIGFCFFIHPSLQGYCFLVKREVEHYIFIGSTTYYFNEIFTWNRQGIKVDDRSILSSFSLSTFRCFSSIIR